MDINLYTIGNDLEFRDSGLIADSDIEEKMHYESSPDIMDMVVQDTFNDSNKNRFNPAAIPSNTDYHLASSNVIGLGSDDSLPNTAIIQQKQQKDSVSHIDYNHSTIFNPKITQIQINSNVRTGQTNLVHTSELGKWASLFNFQSFNQMQSSLFNLIVYTSRNLLVSAPTGSGKTVVFELAIIQALESQQKAVYIAPTRALCQEKFNDWKHRFSKYNISVCLLTGDSLPNNYIANLKTARIIVTTPEKWDSFTRSADNQIMQSVKLCCVDEIHGVRDERRGATLEVVVTRCKYQQCRLVCASATIPNINDFAIWLQAEAKIFGDEYRSVPIKKHVLGYKNTYNQFQLDEILKFNLVDVIKRYGDGKPTLVFCKTRKDVISTCQELAKTPSLFVNSSNRKTLEQVVFKDKKLLEFVKNGVGFHHAGLDYADRQSVEALFMTSKLKVICCTSTLAVGVNLPARMVIIKGTSQYDFSTGKMKQYCDHDINQ